MSAIVVTRPIDSSERNRFAVVKSAREAAERASGLPSHYSPVQPFRAVCFFNVLSIAWPIIARAS
jgi:hypothetical protein